MKRILILIFLLSCTNVYAGEITLKFEKRGDKIHVVNESDGTGLLFKNKQDLIDFIQSDVRMTEKELILKMMLRRKLILDSNLQTKEETFLEPTIVRKSAQ